MEGLERSFEPSLACAAVPNSGSGIRALDLCFKLACFGERSEFTACIVFDCSIRR
jgi:hypothetical protein